MTEIEAEKTYMDSIAELEGKVPPEILAALVATIKVSGGEWDKCPRCGTQITDMRQVGMSVYAGCGCYMYRGWLPEKWRKPLDRVRIGISIENLSLLEQIAFKLLCLI